MKWLQRICVLLVLCMHVKNNGWVAPVNLLRPYNTLLRPEYFGDKPWQLAVYAETGFGDIALNPDGRHTNVLQIWDSQQNALAMLDGFDECTSIGQKRVQIDASDNGVRGRYNVCGTLDERAAFAFVARYFWCTNWTVGAYLPVYSYRLKDVRWTPCTQNVTDDDVRVRRFLTNDFFQNVCRLGNGLDLCGWERTGLGDLTFLFEWFGNYPQRKEFLHSVRVNARAGVSLPTSKRQDEDKIFAFPFGNDGAWAIPFGLGLDLTFRFYFRIGADVLLTHIFGNTRCRRIKTAPFQTEFLFLQKVCAYKDFGMTQRFNLYAELYRFCKGLSLKIGYQYLKHGDDVLALDSTCFSEAIANTAQSVQEWTLHEIMLKGTYEFTAHMSPDSAYLPQVAVYARLPFNGKRAAGTNAVGVIAAVDF